MPSFPHPGSVTVCEINRDLITAETLSDDQARKTYAKVLGTIFSLVSFQTDQLVSSSPSSEQDSEQEGRTEEAAPESRLSAALRVVFNDPLKCLFHPNDVKLLSTVDLHGVSWHQHKHLLSFMSGPNHVTVRDYNDSGQYLLLIAVVNLFFCT